MVFNESSLLLHRLGIHLDDGIRNESDSHHGSVMCSTLHTEISTSKILAAFICQAFVGWTHGLKSLLI